MTYAQALNSVIAKLHQIRRMCFDTHEVLNMTTIVIVRHGETDWNKAGRLQGHEDILLNEQGRWQAKRCGDYLRDTTWDVIVSSPLQRALETAKIIRQSVRDHVPLMQMPQFMERNYGLASGLTMNECQILYPHGEYPEAEVWEDLRSRAMKGLEELRGQYPDGNILLVAHGGIINAILATISGGEIGTGKTRLLNAGFSRIKYAQGSWQVMEYNEAQHLLE